MATSSFFHNVVIKDAETAKSFIRAVEHSEKNPPKPVIMSCPVEKADKEWIRKHLKK
jgi:hypothetical protein